MLYGYDSPAAAAAPSGSPEHFWKRPLSQRALNWGKLQTVRGKERGGERERGGRKLLCLEFM